MATKTVLDQLASSFAAAVNDVREKVVEEPWFGKATTPSEASTAYEELKEQYTPKGIANPEPEPEIDQDIDR